MTIQEQQLIAEASLDGVAQLAHLAIRHLPASGRTAELMDAGIGPAAVITAARRLLTAQ